MTRPTPNSLFGDPTRDPPLDGETVAGSVYRDLWETHLDACYLLSCERDAAGQIVDFVFVDANQRGVAALNLVRAAIIGRKLCDLARLNPESEHFKRYAHVVETGETLDEEGEFQLGEFSAPQIRLRVIATKHGIAIVARDLAIHAAAPDGVRLAAIVFEHATEAIVVSDAHDRIVTVNQAFCALTGYFQEEVVGRPATDFETTGFDVRDNAKMFEQVASEGSWSGQGTQLRKDDAPFPTWRNVVCVTDDAGQTLNYVRIATDITAIQQSREQFERAANHDSLTGLPNRRLFMDRLSHALALCPRSQQKLAVLFVDLDNFKAVNDRFGHVIGDELLKEVANRLSHSARAVDTVCRLSGDEFTIVMEDLETVDLGAAGLVAKRIIDALSKPFTLSGHTVTASASIGISLYPADGTDAEALIRNADAALYRAKELGRNRYHYYCETIDLAPPGRINIENALGGASEAPG